MYADFGQGYSAHSEVMRQWYNGYYLSPYFICHSEREWGGGFVDLFLAPFFFRYPDMKHGYLIELKYLKRGEDNPIQRQTVIAKAEAQLKRYAADERVKQGMGTACLHPLILVCYGWELVYRAEREDQKTED